jgi:hypothetical protein
MNKNEVMFIYIIIVLVAVFFMGFCYALWYYDNPPKPLIRQELVDESHHVIYSYESHDIRVLSQSPGLTLRTWKEVEP